MSNQNKKTIPVSFRDSSAEPVPFFHVWLYPSRRGMAPGDAREPLSAELSNTLTLACSPGGGEKSIKFHQDLELCVGQLPSEGAVHQPPHEPSHTKIQMLEGDLDINGEKLGSGDTALVDEDKELRLSSQKGAHFLLFDLC
jgi:quercetin 2,3-dioxygenase